jgi:hypothetical protein
VGGVSLGDAVVFGLGEAVAFGFALNEEIIVSVANASNQNLRDWLASRLQ